MTTRILIAEDNASVRAAMRQVLENVGRDWEIIEAEDGFDAIAKAQQFRPSLIVLDLVMPSMDGFTAARVLNALLPDTPILMHTMFSSPMVELEAHKIGVRTVVPKSESGAFILAVEQFLHSEPTESFG